MSIKLVLPVHCRCGGEPEVYSIKNPKLTAYYIQCEDCGTKTSMFKKVIEAIGAWNKVMADRRTKVKYLEKRSETSLSWEGICTKCGSYTMHDMNYCFHCGCRLEWE